VNGPKYKNEEILNPPAYQPTEHEIKLAKARYAMENNIWEMMHSLIQYHELNNGKEPSFPYTKEGIENEAKNAIEKWNKIMNKWDNEDDVIEAFVNDEWFQKCYVSGLSEIHSGDCTAFPSSCQRCHSEELFRIPNSATWKGKHEGYRLWAEFSADIDKHKKEEAEKKGESNV